MTSSYTEEDCFEKSRYYCSTGELQQNWIFHLEDPVSTKTAWCESPTSMVGLQLLNLWLLKVMLRSINSGVITIKPGHQTTGNAWYGQMSRPSCSYVSRTPKEAYNLGCLVPTVKHWGGSVMVWAAILWYSILLAPLLPFMAKLLQGSMWTGWVSRCVPWSRHFRTIQFS
jgi:hypothetical protein